MVLSAIETQPGIVTFGTEDGLWSYNGTTYFKTAAQNLPPATRVYCQLIDRQKRHWLGTDRITGFIVKGQFQAADPNVNLSGVRAMYEDPQGTLWLGTHGQGLFAYHNNTLRRIQPPGMRLPATVSTLIPVFDTLLAVSSNEGLYLINLNHLHNHLRQPDAPVGYLALIDNNGLKNKEFNGGFQNAVALLPSGNLVFPTIQGAVMLDPHKLNLTPKPIQARIKEVWIDGERHDPTKPVLIPNDFGLLRVITRLGFRDHPHQYIAEYAIDGSNWLPIEDGEIQIRGLQPGNHTLEVRGYPTLYPHLVNSAKVDLRVPVPLTQNPSFYLVLFFVILAFVFVFLRIRTLQITRSNEKLQALVEEKTADLEGIVQELKQSQEMLLQTNYTLGRIMSVLSHNVKGPLKYMTHIAEFLQSNAEQTSPEDLKQTLGSVVDSGKGMVDLMEDVLQWAKVQGTRMELNRTRVNLNKKLEEEMLIQAAPAQQKQVELINETHEEIAFETDGNLLSLILQNLLSNAIKFSMPGQQVLLNAKTRDGKVQIAVTDHGVGISPTDLKNLFNPKRTESKVGTSGEKGSGIGLLITKDLVTRLDGKIWAISREDHGTTFFIEFPEHPAAQGQE
jgi:signal transduction histidine kinase